MGRGELGGQISAIPAVPTDASEVCLQISFTTWWLLVAQRVKTSKEQGAGGGSLGPLMSPAQPPALLVVIARSGWSHPASSKVFP